MNPVLDPKFSDVRMDPSYWTSKRASAMGVVYPDGELTGQPDAIVEGWGEDDKPPEASSITRLTISEPGGRSGGSPIYVEVCHPVGQPANGCMLFFAGHCSGDVGWLDPDPEIGYVGDYSISPIRRALAAGITVVAINMANYGSNPLQTAVLNGTLTTMNTHGVCHLPGGYFSSPEVSFPIAGPSMTRFWTDHPKIAMNWITSNLGITKFACIGHSGGGSASILFAPVESRIAVWHILQGCWALPDDTPGASVFMANEWENMALNDLFLACQHRNYGWGKDAIAVAASFPNRKTVVHYGMNDDWWDPALGDRNVLWRDALEPRAVWINRASGGTSTLQLRPSAGGHAITPEQAAFVQNHIEANL